MAPILAQFERNLDANRSRFWFRGESHDGPIDASVHGLAPGAVVRLRDIAPPWHVVEKVRIDPQFAPSDRFAGVFARPATVLLDQNIGSRATKMEHVVLDWRGRPCAIACERWDSDVAFVVDYTGMGFSVLVEAKRTVRQFDTPAGRVWAVMPEDVVYMAENQAELHAQPGVVRTPGGPAPNLPLQDLLSEQETPPELIDKPLKFSAVEFRDGSVRTQFRGAAVEQPTTWSLAVLDAVKGDFDRQYRQGLRLQGQIASDGTQSLRIEGLDVLANDFDRHWRSGVVARTRSRREWLDADDLATRRPNSKPLDNASSLLDIDEFGLGAHKKAFARLYRERQLGEMVFIMPNHGFIVPLPPDRHGHLLYAWEITQGASATYLFRPLTSSSRDALLKWTAGVGALRRELLATAALQTEVGFLQRVLHREADDGRDPWWSEVWREMSSE